MGIKGKKEKRNFHHKAKPVKPVDADADAIARMTATLFTAAASRVLRDKYGWTPEAAVTFGDQMAADAIELANAPNDRGRALEAEQAAATSGYVKVTAAGTSDGPTAVTMPVTVTTADAPDFVEVA